MPKIAVQTILLLYLAGTTGFGAAISGQDKGDIPPDLLYQRVSIAPEENAIIDWRRAAKVFVPVNADSKTNVLYAWTPGARRPAEDDQAKLRAWLKRNQQALDLFETSLGKPKAQWPELDGQPEAGALNQLIRARLLEADELAENGKFEQAAQSLKGSLRLAQIGVESDAGLSYYLIAGSSRARVHGGILRLASRSETPYPILAQLLKELPSIDSETNTFSRILRVEFTLFEYPSIDFQRIAEMASKRPGSDLAMTFFPKVFRRPFKVLFDPYLISLHPKPYDTVEKIKRSERYFRIYRTNSFSAWAIRNKAAEDERLEMMKKLLYDIRPLMELVANEPLPLSRQAAERARSAYVQIENPVGRIGRCEDVGWSDCDIRVFTFRLDREVTRTILATLIFERKKGQLPKSLSDLVDEKIVDSIPIDPFAGNPLHYSRERREVWSVGEDGVDNDGEGNPFSPWLGKDAVWEIPKIK